MLHYLYYKFYRAAERSSLADIAAFAACVWLAGIIAINLLTIQMLLAKLDVWRVVLIGGFSNIAVIGLLIGIVLTYFFNKKRYLKLVDKYAGESKEQRKKGNVIVRLYVLFSIIIFFVVSLYKPGYLPKM